MVYTYKYITSIILSGEITPQNIMNSELAESVICIHKMLLRDLFALWNTDTIKNNTSEEFNKQIEQSYITTEYGTSYDNVDYKKKSEESFLDNILRRKNGYKQWILQHLNTECIIISINTSEIGTLNIAFDANTNIPIYSRCSAWVHSYQSVFMQKMLANKNSLKKIEYPMILTLIETTPEEAIKNSHHFSVIN